MCGSKAPIAVSSRDRPNEKTDQNHVRVLAHRSLSARREMTPVELKPRSLPFSLKICLRDLAYFAQLRFNQLSATFVHFNKIKRCPAAWIPVYRTPRIFHYYRLLRRRSFGIVFSLLFCFITVMTYITFIPLCNIVFVSAE